MPNNIKNRFGRLDYYNILAVILLCSVGLISYSNTFHNSFQFDDYDSILGNFNIRSISNLKMLWNFWPTRFITYLSLAFNYRFGQFQVFGYHLFNLLVHLGAGILVWRLVLLTFSTPVMREEKMVNQAGVIAFFAALVFITHPIQTEAVTYLIQRATSLAAFFYLASLSLYVKSRLLQYETVNSKAGRLCYDASLIAAITAMFSKEMSITLPLMILLYEFCFLKTKKSIPWLYLAPFFVAILIIPLTMAVTKSVNFIEMRRITESTSPILPFNYLLTQFRVIVTYLRLLFIPIRQNLYYDYPLSKSLMELPTLASFFLLLFVLTAASKIFSRARLISFAVFWFFLTLLPESSIIPIKDVIVEHRLYLPMAGYSIFLVSATCYLFARKSFKPMAVILSIVVIGYSVLTYNRNFIWKDEISLWSDVIHKSPRRGEAYNNRAVAYENKGDFKLAIADYNQAIEVNPNLSLSYSNRGFAYQKQGDFKQAMSDYDKAIEIDPNCVAAYTNRGFAYQNRGNLERAVVDYTRAIEIFPGHALAYNNRGTAYQTLGHLAQAIADYNKAIEIDSEDASAYTNRGVAYQALGNLEQSLSDYNKAININPDFALAYMHRAAAYFFKKEYNRSWEDVHKAEKLGIKVNATFLSDLIKSSGRER